MTSVAPAEYVAVLFERTGVLGRFGAQVMTEQLVVAFDDSVSSDVHGIDDVEVVAAHGERHDGGGNRALAGDLLNERWK